jgi:hypothetical protein
MPINEATLTNPTKGVVLIHIESIKRFYFTKVQKACCMSRKIGLKISENNLNKYFGLGYPLFVLSLLYFSIVFSLLYYFLFSKKKRGETIYLRK